MKSTKQKIVMSKATGRWLLVSPRKANLVAGLVRGKSVENALVQLSLSNKKSAKLMLKIVKSAMANAGEDMKADQLKVGVQVGSAGMWKRMRPRAFGRANVRRRRRSHIWVELYTDAAAGAFAS